MDNTFKESIAFNSGGDKIVVTGSNYVSVYQNTNNNWEILGSKITVSSEEQSVRMSVAINDNGKVLVVGMPSEKKVKVFEYKHSEWSQLGQNIETYNFGRLFGYSVDIDAEGLTVVAAQPATIESHLNVKTGDLEQHRSSSVGAVNIYKYDSESGNWSEKATIDNGGYSPRVSEFAKKVKISKDASTLLVSSKDRTYIYYERSGRTSRWAKEKEEISGVSCDLNQNGSRILSNNGNFLELYSYEKNQNLEKIYEFPSLDNGSENSFVSINSIGNTIAFTTKLGDSGYGDGQVTQVMRNVYIFEENIENQWQQVQLPIRTNDVKSIYYGLEIKLNSKGDKIAISDPPYRSEVYEIKEDFNKLDLDKDYYLHK